MTTGCGLLHQIRPASKIFTTIGLVSETGIFFGNSAKAAGRNHRIDRQAILRQSIKTPRRLKTA
jgi:hypothetical protein